MDLNSLLKILNEHKQEIQRNFGVKSLRIFGSTVRGENKPESDIDILVEFNGPATFDEYMDLKIFLEDLLGKQIDLVTEKALKPRLRPYIEKEAIYVA